uniref:Ig-like domain-containing protein n=1 Tax=Oncorhynchus tshawytscha TaxID=74940 RepID=A0AAZ3S7N5_ONCTS
QWNVLLCCEGPLTLVILMSDGLIPYCGGTSNSWQLFSSMVHQRPVALTEGPGGDVQLTCSHTIPNYYMILWYKQSAGDTAMKLIGYAYTKSITMEKSFDKHFNVSGDSGKEAYLHLVSLRGPEHSAVYYCAASQHSDVDILLFSTKTLSD